MGTVDFPSQMLAASCGNTLELWPGQPGRGPTLLTHDHAIAGVAWNRNNKVVAAGGGDGTVLLYHGDGNLMNAIPRDPRNARGRGSLGCLSWSSGSQLLAAGSSAGATYVLDFKTQDPSQVEKVAAPPLFSRSVLLAASAECCRAQRGPDAACPAALHVPTCPPSPAPAPLL